VIELDKKGQTYIATAVMISAMILAFGFLIKTAIINPHKTNFLMENVKVEPMKKNKHLKSCSLAHCRMAKTLFLEIFGDRTAITPIAE